MKKPFLAALLAALAAVSLAAQEAPDTGAFSLLNRRGLQEYSSQFLSSNTGLLYAKYDNATSDKDYEGIAPLSGDVNIIDTPLEIAVLSFSAGVVDIRPAEAAEMLPKGRESSIKVGALIYQNLQAATFLRSSNAAALATVFNQFCVDNGVNKAEIKTYFDRNIGTAIAAEIDAQFNRVHNPATLEHEIRNI
jgi:hypothetical protein